MTLSRRGFVRLLGGGVVLAATVGVGLTQCDQMPASAVAGWAGPGAETEPRRRALSFALLAPNPHNRQQWIADLKTPDEIRLFVDTTRMLPMTDPPGRQVVIGCGCFLETLVLAANSEGWATDVSLWPEGVDEADLGARPFAVVTFAKAEPADPDRLAAQILKRRSFKIPYDPARPLSAEHQAGLASAVVDQDVRLSFAKDANTVAALRDIATKAFRIEVDTDRTFRESVELMRVGANEIAKHRDGLELHGPFFWWLKQFGMLSVDAQMERGGTARETAMSFLDADAASTTTFAWIATETNTREMQLRAGRIYVRMNLAALRDGFAMAPWSQVLQEFPEMAALQGEFKSLIGAAPQTTVQMFVRLGYADAPGPTPRRALDDIIRA